jgi:predicted deacetylase
LDVTDPTAPRVAVSLHDVAPQTWAACERLLSAVAQVAAVPVTLLVVPDYHGDGLRQFNAAYQRALNARLQRGDELALHGWSHRDTAPLHNGPLDTLRRTQLTALEGEFAALPASVAASLLERGCAWFDKQGWPLHGFVAPAWLLGPGAWSAIARFPFEYTATLGHLHLLPERASVATRTIVYSLRSPLRKRVSLLRNAALSRLPGAQPLRLALHPSDAGHDEVVRQIQAMLRSLMSECVALTKAQLACELRRQRGMTAGTSQRGRGA